MLLPAAPDQLAVFVYFLYPVHRYGMYYPLMVHDLYCISSVWRKKNICERDPDNFVLDPIVIADFKIITAEFLVPLYAAKKFMDRYHGREIQVSSR